MVKLSKIKKKMNYKIIGKYIKEDIKGSNNEIILQSGFNITKETLDKIGDNPVYITFDLDSLDASVAPAVSNIEPSFTGFTIDEAKTLIQSVKNKNVIGGDVVCLMPTKDQQNNITSMVAASIMFEIISVIAYK